MRTFMFYFAQIKHTLKNLVVRLWDNMRNNLL